MLFERNELMQIKRPLSDLDFLSGISGKGIPAYGGLIAQGLGLFFRGGSLYLPGHIQKP